MIGGRVGENIMLKISLIALVGLCVVLSCGCISASKPTSIEISTDNLGTIDQSKEHNIEEVNIILYDLNGNSVKANGILHCVVRSGTSVTVRDGVIQNIQHHKIINETSIHINENDFSRTDGAISAFKVVHRDNLAHIDQSTYEVHNYVTPKDYGSIIDPNDVVTSSFDPSQTNIKGSTSYSKLIVEVDFTQADGSTLHAEKLLKA